MRTIAASVAVVGAAGSATGAVSIGLGDVTRLYAVQPIYDGAAPVTTVITATSQGRTVATVPAGSVTPRQYPVLEQAYDTGGVAIVSGQAPQREHPCLSGTMTVTVTLANAGTYGLLIYLMD